MSQHGRSVTRTMTRDPPAAAARRPGPVSLPADVRGRRIHLVGVKGTGMAALAEVLAARGALLTGADVAEQFQTRDILDRLQVRPTVGFAAADLPAAVDWVVHSAAYDRAENPQLAAAAARGIPVISYPEALGALSRAARSIAISGVHGKTTTAALCGLLVDALDLPATVLTGTGVPNFDGRATLMRGTDYLVAETCEYRNHFANFDPRHVVLTSVELEHVDAFPTHAAVVAAFTGFACSMAAGGSLIYAAGDPGAVEVAGAVRRRRPDLRLCPYGESAAGALRVSAVAAAAGATCFRIACLAEPVTLRVAGRHHVDNAAAAVAVARTLLAAEGRALAAPEQQAVRAALSRYRGGKRRTEIVGEQRGILVLDDYAHHPTEVASTLAGLRSFYPDRRLVVDFMSHTFSRTAALLDRFATAFGAAHEVLLHPVYASARELPPGVEAGARPAPEAAADAAGRALLQAVARHHGRVRYCPTFAAATDHLAGALGPGDLLVTMGAGDNWRIGRDLLGRLRQGTHGGGA